jgi:hypothetical protein
MDRQQRAAKGSLESCLADDAGPRSSPQMGEKREGLMVTLTSGDFGWQGSCVGPTTRKHGGSQQSSTRDASEQGGAITEAGMEVGCEAGSPHAIYMADGDARRWEGGGQWRSGV